MDKEFWMAIFKNKYEIPGGHTLTELTRELFSFLGSTDLQLRDEIGYTFYANWLKQDRYSIQEIRDHVRELLANLNRGIGGTENDSVFLRSFSILFLAEIVYNDNQKSFLEKSDILNIFDKGIWYVSAENDPRGYIPVKGWAHALAHSADLMFVLAKNKHLGGKDLSIILNTISMKIFRSNQYVYIHGEDERLANAVLEALRRNLISTEHIEAWAASFYAQDWTAAFMDENRNLAYHNTRNLLRSIYLEICQVKEGFPGQNNYENIFLDALKKLKPF